jgi:CheY-like chemotaxis protein
MDIMMPIMDGYETMTAIRKLPDGKDLPIIAVTAKVSDGERQRCLEAGGQTTFPSRSTRPSCSRRSVAGCRPDRKRRRKILECSARNLSRALVSSAVGHGVKFSGRWVSPGLNSHQEWLVSAQAPAGTSACGRSVRRPAVTRFTIAPAGRARRGMSLGSRLTRA